MTASPTPFFAKNANKSDGEAPGTCAAPVQPASAAVPSEAIERVIRDWQMTPGFDGWDAKVAALVAALSALFAPILAEKEREITSREPTAFAIELGRKLAALTDRAESAEARALAAETERDALKAKLEMAGKALEPFASYHEEAEFLDDKGAPMPDAQHAGYVYIGMGDFRRARSASAAIRGEG